MIRIHALSMLLGCLFFVQASFGQIKSYDPDRIYSTNALKADLRFLQGKLKRTHPALYRYTPKPSMDRFFDSLYHSIDHPMKESDFLSLITLLNAKIGDGHTMFLPSQAATEYNNTRGKFLPFSVAFADGKLYVREPCKLDRNIEWGEEILSINGISTATIMRELLSRQIRDGNNMTYPVWILNHYFSAYYSFVYGQPNRFSLDLKDANGELHKEKVMALTKDSINSFLENRFGTRSVLHYADIGELLEEKEEGVTATLTIRSFDSEAFKALFNEGFKRICDSIFSRLQLLPIQNLILDLRDNQGGDFETGRYLLSWLLLKPSRYLLGGKETRLIQPKSNHFTGKIFVLINGGSFSNTAIVSAILEKEQRAVFIGEETGGNRTIISGNPVEEALPETKIRCFISTNSFRISADTNDGHGVLPTHPFHPNISDIMEGNDTSMTMALKLITDDQRQIFHPNNVKKAL